MADLASQLRQYGNNAATNLRATLERLTPKQSLRLVVIVCAYMLFRKYVLAHAAKRQERQLEAEAVADKTAPALSANALRGGKAKTALEREAQTFKYPGIPYDSDEEDEGEGGSGTGAGAGAVTSGGDVQWGKKATRRQRKVLRMLVDAEEKRLKEKIGDDGDKDIEEFLVDEGK